MPFLHSDDQGYYVETISDDDRKVFDIYMYFGITVYFEHQIN